MLKTIIVKTMNATPEPELNEELEKLGPGWKVVSSSYAIAPWGEMREALQMPCAMHVYHTAMVIVEKTETK